MGEMLSINIRNNYDPRLAPRTDRPTTFDPLAGFPNGRKEREMVATWEEMENWGLRYGARDYCAHKLIAVLKCRKEHRPISGRFCWEIEHEYHKCELEDQLIRRMEYAREKRLLERKVRKEDATAKLSATQLSE